MRNTLHFGSRTFAASRYRGMMRYDARQPQDRLVVYFDNPRESYTAHGGEAIDAAVAEIEDAFCPDEPDYYWQSLGGGFLAQS